MGWERLPITSQSTPPPRLKLKHKGQCQSGQRGCAACRFVSRWTCVSPSARARTHPSCSRSIWSPPPRVRLGPPHNWYTSWGGNTSRGTQQRQRFQLQGLAQGYHEDSMNYHPANNTRARPRVHGGPEMLRRAFSKVLSCTISWSQERSKYASLGNRSTLLPPSYNIETEWLGSSCKTWTCTKWERPSIGTSPSI
jgi:hypothetical protein